MKTISLLLGMLIPISAIAQTIDSNGVLVTMQKVADWQLANPGKYGPKHWAQTAFYPGVMALGRIDGGGKYIEAMKAIGEKNRWQLHEVTRGGYHADGHMVAQTYCELYEIFRDPQMIAPTKAQFDRILADPDKRPVGFHHPRLRQIITGVKEEPDTTPKDPTAVTKMRFWWADSLFMAPPSWLLMFKITGEKKYMEFAVNEWKAAGELLYRPEDGLFDRDVYQATKRDPSGKKLYWARANGWVIAGLVRVLQIMPAEHPARPFFEKQFTEMLTAIAKLQQEDGLWRSNLVNPTQFPIGEASGSGFFTYAYAWGVNNGLLDRAKFEPIINRAWHGLVACVEPDGKLTHVQPEGSGPDNFESKSSVPYGAGAFLLAGSEIYKLKQK